MNEWQALFEEGLVAHWSEQKGRPERIEPYRTAIKRDPNDVRAHVVLAGAEAARSRDTKVPDSEHLYWLIEHAPEVDLGDMWHIALSDKDVKGEVVRRWGRAVERHPRDHVVLANAIKCVRGNPKAEIGFVERWVELEPTDAVLRQRLARLYRSAGDAAAAYATFERALALTHSAEDCLRVSLELAEVARDAGEYARARELAAHGLRVAQDISTAVVASCTLGKIMIDYGDANAATAQLFICAVTPPPNRLSDAAYALARALVYVGRRLEVERYYEACRGREQLPKWQRLVDALK